jgi:hypothetical protein
MFKRHVGFPACAVEKSVMSFDYHVLVENFGRIWPVHVEAFTELLIALRRQFGGDLDRMLVLAVIGTRTLHRGRSQGLSYDDFQTGRHNTTPDPLPINVQSITACTGIPRETVRRKVRELEALGWIIKADKGHLIVTEQAAKDLAPGTEATLRYLTAIGTACSDLATPE